MKRNACIVPNKLKPKGQCNNPHNYNFNQFQHWKFDANTTNSIFFISHILRSRVEIYQLRLPMSYLFQSLYDIIGLAPRMDVLFLGRHDFLNKFLEQGYVKERLKSSLRLYYGQYLDLMLNDIL